jgi:histidine triad (HIT) family protein
MSDTIFTKIIKGEIPCFKIYEDDLTLAFLDIKPIQPGHTLVISKRQIDSVWDLPEEDYRALMDSTKRVANRLHEMFPEKLRIAMIIEGLDVPHAHVKLFPIDNDSEFRFQPDKNQQPDYKQLEQMAKRIAF